MTIKGTRAEQPSLQYLNRHVEGVTTAVLNQNRVLQDNAFGEPDTPQDPRGLPLHLRTKNNGQPLGKANGWRIGSV